MKSIFDRAVDILIERQQLATIELQRRFKGVDPFRKEKVSDEQRIGDYMKWAGQPMEQELRQQFGDEQIDGIHNDMHDLINRGTTQ